jgi:Arc/MetJ family transcription regulator
MEKVLTLKIDTDLLAQAQQELGTTDEDATVERALQEAINLRRRQRLAEVVIPGLTPERLEEIRRNRTA